MYRTDDGWLVKLELAGVRLDEIRLMTDGPHLIVEGTRAMNTAARRRAATAWRSPIARSTASWNCRGFLTITRS